VGVGLTRQSAEAKLEAIVESLWRLALDAGQAGHGGPTYIAQH
jgi:hypothetical protein